MSPGKDEDASVLLGLSLVLPLGAVIGLEDVLGLLPSLLVLELGIMAVSWVVLICVLEEVILSDSVPTMSPEKDEDASVLLELSLVLPLGAVIGPVEDVLGLLPSLLVLELGIMAVSWMVLICVLEEVILSDSVPTMSPGKDEDATVLLGLSLVLPLGAVIGPVEDVLGLLPSLLVLELGIMTVSWVVLICVLEVILSDSAIVVVVVLVLIDNKVGIGEFVDCSCEDGGIDVGIAALNMSRISQL